MIDTASLMRPFDQLAATLGTGDLAGPGLDGALPQATTLLRSAADDTGTAGLQVAPHWSGTAAATALGVNGQVQVAAGALGDRGGQLELNLLDAASTVLTGVAELATIATSFLGVLRNADQLMSNPIGQLTLLKSALDHLSPAIGVVVRVSSELSGHTAQLQALTAPTPIPQAPATTLASVPGPPPAQLAAAVGTPGPAPGGVQVQLPDGSVATAPNQQAADAVRNALSQQGVPYSWGGTTPGAGFDCSGLVQWAYGDAGVDLPRMAHEQGVGTRVDPSQVMPGDLAIWSGHAAMVIGNGQMVEATGDPVGVNPIRTDNGGQQFLGFYRPTA